MREVVAMVTHMPAGSPAWSQTHEIMATVVDSVNTLNHTLTLVNVDKKYKSKVKAPPPFPRPGRKGSRLRGKTMARPTRTFESPQDFMRWRASRLRPYVPGR